MTPVQAIILSEQPGRSDFQRGFRAARQGDTGSDPLDWNRESGGTTAMVTVHAIHVAHPGDPAAVPMIGPGKPLCARDRERLVALLQSDATNPVDQGFVPGNRLYQSRALTVWHVPGTTRKMFLRRHGAGVTHLTVRWPHLVFAVLRGALYLAAVAGSRRPAPDTRLYHAPLMNLYDSGLVCLGNAETGERNFSAEDTATWEAAIFDTAFSHVNHGRTFRPEADEREIDNEAHVRRWRKLAREGRAPRAGDMAPMGRTLREWIELLEAKP